MLAGDLEASHIPTHLQRERVGEVLSFATFLNIIHAVSQSCLLGNPLMPNVAIWVQL